VAIEVMLWCDTFAVVQERLRQSVVLVRLCVFELQFVFLAGDALDQNPITLV